MPDNTLPDDRRQTEQEARLQYSAMHDSLTGLPNRGLFLDRLRMMLARLQRRPSNRFAVIFLDLDRFESNGRNGMVGAVGGDALLLTMAKRLRGCTRAQDTVARFGGDKFGMLVDELAGPGDVFPVTTRIQAAAQKPVMVGGQSVAVSASIGVVVVTPQYQRSEDVMRAADLAMYAAQTNGRGQQAFAPELHAVGATIPPCPGSERPLQSV
jgi:diguanylate cyclase (GGDEF)-like protein